MSKNNLVEITSRVLLEMKGRPHDEIVSEMNKALSEIREKGVVSWDETRRNDDCSSYIEARTCHYVDHGDGSKSETWCSGWSCK